MKKFYFDLNEEEIQTSVKGTTDTTMVNMARSCIEDSEKITRLLNAVLIEPGEREQSIHFNGRPVTCIKEVDRRDLVVYLEDCAKAMDRLPTDTLKDAVDNWYEDATAEVTARAAESFDDEERLQVLMFCHDYGIDQNDLDNQELIETVTYVLRNNAFAEGVYGSY